MTDRPGATGSAQARKLGLAPGLRVALDHRPAGWTFDRPPDGVVTAGREAPADVLISFFRRAAELGPRLPGLGRRIFPAGALWVAWPRRAGGHDSDLTDQLVRAAALPIGLVDTKVAAIDADWSGLRFVWRVEHRT